MRFKQCLEKLFKYFTNGFLYSFLLNYFTFTVPTLPTSLPSLDVLFVDFPDGSDGKASVYNVGDLGSIPGFRKFPGEGNGNPLQYSCLENPMD